MLREKTGSAERRHSEPESRACVPQAGKQGWFTHRKLSFSSSLRSICFAMVVVVVVMVEVVVAVAAREAEHAAVGGRWLHPGECKKS